MRPLATAAAGLALVAIDVRTERLDLLPDPVGWSLVVVGVVALGLRVPAIAAAGAAALSVAEVHLPSSLRYVDPFTGEFAPPAEGQAEGYGRHLTFDELEGLHLVLVVAAVLAGALALWSLAGALRRRATTDGDVRAARQLGVLGWLLPAAWAGPTMVLAVLHRDGFDPVWNGSQELLALAGIAAVLWFATLLAARSGSRWGLPPAAPLRPLGGAPAPS